MQRLTIRRSLITCFAVILLATAILFGLDRVGHTSRVSGITGTIVAREIDKKQVDNPPEAYRVWKQAGYRGRTLVFVADRWESFDPGEIIPTQMYRAYPLPLYNTARRYEEEYLNGVTFLYAASLNKIIRNIVAIVPEQEVARMTEAARKVKNSRIDARGVSITRQGFPRRFTTGAAFDGAGESVLVYIGASYFRYAEPEELFRQLSSAGLLTDCIVLCNEAGKDTVTAKEVAKLNRFAGLIGLPPPSTGSDSRTTSTAATVHRPLPSP